MKRKSYLMLLTVLLLLYGCAQNDVDHVESAQDIVSIEETVEPTEAIQEETIPKDEQENEQETASDMTTVQLTKEDIAYYMDSWAKYLEPTMTTEELKQLEQIQWDEKIRPYMEYDWVGDEHIDRIIISINSWVMQLADLNMDGQPEMLISEYFYHMGDDLTHVFTIQDGEVVYCGKIIAGIAFEYNESYGGANYLPSYYIDVYQNDAGEFRYLSCEGIRMGDWSYCQIYASTFDGTRISDVPVFAIDFATLSDGNVDYHYIEGERDNHMLDDDENYTSFSQAMKEYMEGYEKVDIDFVVSSYRVPTVAGELPKEQQEIVRNNIIFGFAQALGYMDK